MGKLCSQDWWISGTGRRGDRIAIEGKAHQPEIGEEIFIPASTSHTVRNIGSKGNVWYYGYKCPLGKFGFPEKMKTNRKTNEFRFKSIFKRRLLCFWGCI